MAARSRSSSTVDEEEDVVAPLCTCGQMSFNEKNKQNLNSNSNNDKKKNSWLESSFVHLMTPRYSLGNKSDPQTIQYNRDHPHGFLEEYKLAQQLMEAANGGDVELCLDCIDTVSAALEKDTQRLYADIEVYHDAAESAEQRAKMLRNMNASNNMNLSSTEEAYLQEIDMLRNEVEAREEELMHLKDLYKEQMSISQQLETTEDGLQLQQNFLEVQSQAFDDRRDLLTKSLTEILTEVDKLSLVSIPRALFDLQVDPRGLRYPLINQLRLAFQPKGDVPAEEVRVAWSQATQLLLFLGKLFDYPGTEWKLVPLADCAKLIYRKEIFNLSPGDCRSLMAWNALLDQVVRHAITTYKASIANGYASGNTSVNDRDNNLKGKQYNTNHVSNPPFSSSPTTIGNTELARLDPSDHFGWSEVIHRMASNLLWLSERGGELAAMQVTSMSHCTS